MEKNINESKLVSESISYLSLKTKKNIFYIFQQKKFMQCQRNIVAVTYLKYEKRSTYISYCHIVKKNLQLRIV